MKIRLLREPTIREIYVEGLFDRDLLRWILGKLGCDDVKVYPISVLEISDESVRGLQLTLGERQRVQTAAHNFKEHTELHKRLIFLIDTDMDYLLAKANYAMPLCGTSGTSSELILWKHDVLIKFAQFILQVEDPSDFILKMKEDAELIAVEFAIFRAAKEKLEANWKLIAIEDVIDKKKIFSFEDYCTKVADKNNARKQMDGNFHEAVATVRQAGLNLDIDKKIHGHDIVSALCRKLRLENYSVACIKNADEFSRILMAIAEWDMIANDDTVQHLKELLRPQVI